MLASGGVKHHFGHEFAKHITFVSSLFMQCICVKIYQFNVACTTDSMIFLDYNCCRD